MSANDYVRVNLCAFYHETCKELRFGDLFCRDTNAPLHLIESQ